jgi:uncharacterized protein (TIGR00296 family)
VPLEQEEKVSLLTLSREAIQAAFTPTPKGGWKAFIEKHSPQSSPRLFQAASCFVTLFGKGRKPRGCVGSFDVLGPLSQLVHEYSQQAALFDPRYPAVKIEELNEIEIQISLLETKEEVKEWADWAAGSIGLVVKHGAARAMTMPLEAGLKGWDSKLLREETCKKAGLDPLKWQEYQFFKFSEDSFGEFDMALR